jgi:hypothetical protein
MLTLRCRSVVLDLQQSIIRQLSHLALQPFATEGVLNPLSNSRMSPRPSMRRKVAGHFIA